MIAYKVVGRKTRLGSNATGWEYNQGAPISRFFKEYPAYKKFKKYFPKYAEGKTVKAVKGTVGIMCFSTYEAADRFQHNYSSLTSYGMIIRVEGIGEPVYDFEIIRDGMSLIEILRGSVDYGRAPTGTMAFKSVLVLE